MEKVLHPVGVLNSGNISLTEEKLKISEGA